MSAPEADTTTEEIQWLARIGARDRAALRLLYARYAPSLLTLARRFVGSAPDAEEILQDTFLKIWRHAANYDARKSQPFTWAANILRRTAIDHLRKHHRDPVATPLPDDDAPTLAIAEVARLTAEAQETAEQVDRALALLPHPQRSALELALYSTLTQAEIARQLAQPIGTVKSWIRRGVLDLRAALHSAPS